MKKLKRPSLRFIVEPDESSGGSPAESVEDVAEPQEGADSTEDAGEQEPESFDSGKTLDKIRKLNSEAANLRKRAKDAEEKLAGAGETSKQAESLAAENLRLKVGIKHSLPEGILDRLKGDTEEELLADAEALLKLFSPKAPPSNRPAEALRGGTKPEAEPDETDLDKIGERMFRR